MTPCCLLHQRLKAKRISRHIQTDPLPKTDMRALDQKDVVRLLRSEVNRAGGQTKWAKRTALFPQRSAWSLPAIGRRTRRSSAHSNSIGSLYLNESMNRGSARWLRKSQAPNGLVAFVNLDCRRRKSSVHRLFPVEPRTPDRHFSRRVFGALRHCHWRAARNHDHNLPWLKRSL